MTTEDRHVYANPWMPEICPFLSDALYLLVVGANHPQKVFSQVDPSKALDKAWRKWAECMKGWLEDHGYSDQVDAICHGIRKGVTKMLCNCVEGPPVMSALLRVRSSLRHVQLERSVDDVTVLQLKHPDKLLFIGADQRKQVLGTIGYFSRRGRRARPQTQGAAARRTVTDAAEAGHPSADNIESSEESSEDEDASGVRKRPRRS